MHYTELIRSQKKNGKKKVTEINIKFEQTLPKLLTDTLSIHAIKGSPNMIKHFRD